MKRYWRTLRILAAIMVGLLTALPLAKPLPAAAIDQDVVERVYPAVVQLGPIAEITDDQGEKTIRFLGWGSGTIIHSDGYILTNHHVTDVSDLVEQLEDRPDIRVIEGKMAVFITADTDNPPIPTYIADVVVDEPELDLAVVKITEDLSGNDLSEESLGLPFLPLGDSSALKLGQRIHIFGYPAIGGETITFTSGDISGFTYEAGVEGRAWLKTNATIAGGNSGGTAVDDAGNLVGVPTQGGSGNNPDIVDCRQIVDTNGDGRIDDRDSCVPFGGFINALRPVDLAKPLINQALSGLGPQPTPDRPTRTPRPQETTVPTTPSAVTTPGTPGTPGTPSIPGGTRTPNAPTPTTQAGSGNAQVSRMIIANGITESGYPQSVVTSLPSGTQNVICYFDYSGFESGGMFQMRAFVNGEEVEDAWPATEWDAESNGESGLWWFGWLEAEDLPDGTYEFQIEFDDEVLGQASVEVGGPDEQRPMFSNVTFSSGSDSGQVLTIGDDPITANFSAVNMDDNVEWQAIWYQQNEDGLWDEIFSSPEEDWSEGAEGDFTTELDPGDTNGDGLYRVELNIDGELSATSDLWLSGDNNNNTDERFGPVVFGDGQDEDGNPINPGTEFADPTYELYAIWDYQNMEDGIDYNITWLVDGEVVISDDVEWEGGESGSWSSYLFMQDGVPLPVATYEIQLYIEGEMVQSATATIGDTNNRPTPSPTTSIEDSVRIEGTITDATSGQPIEGAIFVVLAEGVEWADFTDDADQILELTFTDADGRFTLSNPLPRGKSFSIGAFAEGYEPSLSDGVEVSDDLPATVEIEIELQEE